MINYRLVYGISQSQRPMSRGSLHDFGIRETEVCGCNFFFPFVHRKSFETMCRNPRLWVCFPLRFQHRIWEREGLVGPYRCSDFVISPPPLPPLPCCVGGGWRRATFGFPNKCTISLFHWKYFFPFGIFITNAGTFAHYSTLFFEYFPRFPSGETRGAAARMNKILFWTPNGRSLLYTTWN